MRESPDKKHKARLVFEGEIRFGPEYFRLEIDGKLIPRRIFGDKLKWSADSRYLATEEWLTTDYQEGPRTRILLFDMEQSRVSAFKTVQSGFVEEMRFERDSLVYQKHYLATGAVAEAEVELKEIDNWRDLEH